MRLYLKNLTFFLFTVSVTCSCNLTGDYVLDYGNLKVYYDQEDSKKIAENLMEFVTQLTPRIPPQAMEDN